MSQNNKDKYQSGPKCFGTTVRTSFVDEGDKSIPGPGTHRHVRMNQSNPPQWKIGNSNQRDTFLDKFHYPNPSPNIYEPKYQFNQTRNPSFLIPQSNSQHEEKHKDQNNSLLYDPNSNYTKNNYPKFTMGYYEATNYSKETPAPNEYHRQSQKVFFNKTQNSFSIANRPLPYGQHAKWPGVGNYVIEKTKPPTYQYSIGKSDRPDVINGPDAPGTFYEISGNLKRPGAGKTFGSLYYPSKDKKGQQTIFPGPNQYNPQDLKNTQKVITTYSNRIPLENTAVIKYPSPQKYNTQTEFYKKKSLSFTRDQRQKQHINENPGPGAHNIEAQFSSRSGIMGKKFKQQIKLITPAADHYSPNKQFVKDSSPRVINFYSNRVDFSKSITGKQVGPGSYQVEKQTRAELGKISKSMKFAKDLNKNPGPGSYELPNGIGKFPKYYSGVKKITHDGYSTFTIKMWEKQKREQSKLLEMDKQKQVEQNMTNSQKI